MRTVHDLLASRTYDWLESRWCSSGREVLSESSGSVRANECGSWKPSIGVEESTSRVSYCAPGVLILSVIWGSKSGAGSGWAAGDGDLDARQTSSDCG